VVIRDATPADAAAIAALIGELGYPTAAAHDVARRIELLSVQREPPLAAEADGLAGVLTWHVTPVLHRAGPVGRVTMLVVASAWRGRGVGRALVEAAEVRMWALGCAMIEVTSNLRREDAHAFYDKLGFERTSYRFSKLRQPAR
jgi:GNAT superfamily N-acetyltransferase